VSALGEAACAAEQAGSTALAAMLRASASLLAGDSESAALPRDVVMRLHRDAWEMQARLSQVAAVPGIDAAFGDVVLLARDLGERLVALIALVDTLVDEAERLHGTQAGRGRYKRQQVKAALLYAARRGGYDIPWVPSLLEPAVFSLGADLLIDFTVAHVNQNALWDTDRLTGARLGIGARIASPPLLLLRQLLDRGAAWLAGLAWRLVLGANQLSPGLRVIVDRVAGRDAGALAAVAELRTLITDNPGLVRSLAAVFAIGTQQAEVFVHLSGAQKQAYVRALVMIVLRQHGLAGRSVLLDRIIEQVVTVGIDATVAIFNRRGGFRRA